MALAVGVRVGGVVGVRLGVEASVALGAGMGVEVGLTSLSWMGLRAAVALAVAVAVTVTPGDGVGVSVEGSLAAGGDMPETAGVGVVMMTPPAIAFDSWPDAGAGVDVGLRELITYTRSVPPQPASSAPISSMSRIQRTLSFIATSSDVVGQSFLAMLTPIPSAVAG